MVITFVFLTATHQDHQAKVASLRLAETAIATKKENIARNLKDYAFWQDAFDNLHVKVNTDWAATDGNVGANIFNSLGYELAFVLSPDLRTVYAIREGKPVTIDGLSAMPTVRALLPEAAKGGPAAVGFVSSGDEIYVVGASAILPPNAADAPPPEARSIMVFADRIDATLLQQLSHNYLLEDLRFASSQPAKGASLPVVDAQGRTLGYLAWMPDRPGRSVLRTVLPPLGGVLIGLLVFASIVLRNARRSALAIQRSSETIKAYALDLQRSESRFRDVAEASSDWIWETDPEFRLTYVSDRIGQMTGLRSEDLIGTSVQEFFLSDMSTDGWSQLRGMVSRRSAFRDLRCAYADKNSTRRICRIAGRPILDKAGTFHGYRGTAADVTEEVAAQERANHLALHDPLTGLPNRVLWKERLTIALEGFKRDKTRMAVLCLDLDHFKDVNDTLGHSAGDALLQQLAHRLQDLTRGTDTVARLGGDEFAILQVAVNQPEDAETLSRRILAMFNDPFIVEGSELYVGVSIGIAVSTDEETSEEELLKHADLALYRAKQAGRGTYRFFEASMDSELQARKTLEQELRRAIVKHELQLFYQPLVSVEGQELKGVEALLRWAHPVRGMVSPAEFIPLAEETGLIVPVGEWVLRTACEQATRWPDIIMAVNVSAVQFKNRDFVESVRQILSETGLEPNRLELEITEGVLLYDTAAALDILTQLKGLGVRIAMDDFGTGYSSLGYLNSFPFDKIKIDRSFIVNVADTDKSSAIVKSVISLGQSLSMVTIAEGVETSQQLDFLRAEGCHEVQGYYFGKPVPPHILTNLLLADNDERTFHYDPTRMRLLSTTAGREAHNPGEPQRDLLPKPPRRGTRRACSATARERQDLRRAVGFARRQGKALDLSIAIAAPAAVDEASAAKRWFSLGDVMTGWAADHGPGERPDLLYAWVRAPRNVNGEDVCHLLLHCPSPVAARALRRKLRAWSKPFGGRVAAPKPMAIKPAARAVLAPLFGLAPRLPTTADQVIMIGPRYGICEGLDLQARQRWEEKRRRDAAARNSNAAFRDATDRSETLSRLMGKALVEAA